jgi:hypothetical protein
MKLAYKGVLLAAISNVAYWNFISHRTKRKRQKTYNSNVLSPLQETFCSCRAHSIYLQQIFISMSLTISFLVLPHSALWALQPMVKLGLCFTVSLQTVGRTPCAGDQPVARPLHTKDNTNIHASSGIRTHNPSVRAGENSSCLRQRGHCYRPLALYASLTNILFLTQGAYYFAPSTVCCKSNIIRYAYIYVDASSNIIMIFEQDGKTLCLLTGRDPNNVPTFFF